MKDGLVGKVALVTGAGTGIGRASALAFIEQGVKVVVSDVNVEGGEETVRKIKERGGEAIFVKADVTKAVEVDFLVNKTIEIYYRLDFAHNNAGVEGMKATTADYTEENWDLVMNTNLKSVWLCMKYEIPQMLKLSNGSIVNTSSTFGLFGARNLSAYSASKHGVVGLTKSAALEYAHAGIRINAVCPGGIRTGFQERLSNISDPRAEAQLIAKYPIGRIGIPEEIAEAVVWLCSDAASFITGHSMVIDGGRTL